LPRSSEASPGLGKLVDAIGHPSGFHHRASVVLSIVPLIGQATARASEQARRWGLTAAEETLWRALRDGKTPAEHAAAKGVKISTVRSQIRALLEKSECQSLRSLLAFRVD
jgi:DNA-binding CsgD family transcriptional regulator